MEDVNGVKGRPDACVIEMGGTVGDIESAPFIEALRQFQFRVGKEKFHFNSRFPRSSCRKCRRTKKTHPGVSS